MRSRAAAVTLVTVVLAGCAMADERPQVATHVDDWRDEIIYEIVVDRFDNGDPGNDFVGAIGPVAGELERHQGGDWAGIRRRLGYLERLGVTSIWISPIVANVDRTDYQDGYHGYWASTFTELNPRFGDLDELRALVDDAHDRGIKVIIDVVINHTGRVFFYDLDGDGAMDPGEAEPTFSMEGAYDAPIVWLTDRPQLFRYPAPGAEPELVTLGPEHFHRRGQTSDGSALQKELGDFPTGLRDLDSENDELVAMLVDTWVRWVELTDVDGFRLDAVPHAPHALWRSFAEQLRPRLAAIGKDKFLLLGEVFTGDPGKLAGYTGDGGLDSVFDFSLKDRLIEGFLMDGEAPAVVAPVLEAYRDFYPDRGHPGGIGLSPWQARIGFADNHDMPRLRYWLDDPWLVEAAMTILFTVDAIPAIYYGTEQGFSGGWDNDSREVMWERGFSEDGRTYRHIARLAELRKQSRALRRGAIEVVYASSISARESAPGAGLLAYERYTEDGERVLVAVSGHPTQRTAATFATGFAPGTLLRDALTDRLDRWRVSPDGRVHVDLPPREAVVLVPE
jgi:glycosidase